MPSLKIAVVIPCHRVARHVLPLLARIGPEAQRIYVVDDACPEGSGDLVARECTDPRVVVVRNERNLGVGGAVLAGYRRALDDGMDVLVKLDGDGQMDPALLPAFVAPIVAGEADYAKGNRFHDLDLIGRMPRVRIVGNAALSFMTKLSTGYWDLFDPTNGYTAIHADVARRLDPAKLSARYFFESDLLFRLGTLRAVVVDVPMAPLYGDETSGLKVSRVLGEFAFKHARNFAKRVFYNYFLRDMSVASIELLLGVPLLLFGLVFGAANWWELAGTGRAAPAGTVMLAALPVIVGMQFVLAFLAYDIANVPRRPLQRSDGPVS
jgi:glycosyltransferase involved in cell wall biosynthesis